MRTALAAALVAVLALPSLAHAAAAPATPGKDRTEAFIATTKKVKQDDGKLTEAEKATNARLFTELDGFLDFDVLVNKPVAPRADKFKPEELTTFKAKFKELIRLTAYPKSGNFFATSKLTFQPEQVKGETLEVPLKVHIPEEDLEMVVGFIWSKSTGSLKIVDILFDGDSLVKDYQNQVSKKFDKDGVPGLMKILDEKAAELKKGGTK